MVYKSTEPLTYSGERGELVKKLHEEIDSKLQQNHGSIGHIIDLTDALSLREDISQRPNRINDLNWLFQKIVNDYATQGQWSYVVLGSNDEDPWDGRDFKVLLVLTNDSSFYVRGWNDMYSHFCSKEKPKPKPPQKSAPQKKEESQPSFTLALVLVAICSIITIFGAGIKTFFIGIVAIGLFLGILALSRFLD
jgi:K+-sensing histidine kinase KdpD